LKKKLVARVTHAVGNHRGLLVPFQALKANAARWSLLKISAASRMPAVAINLYRIARARTGRAAILLTLFHRAATGRVLADIFVVVVSHRIILH
jgi:hypothetical protein